MKNKLFIVLFLGIAIAACHKDNSTVAPTVKKSNSASHAANRLPVSLQDTLSSGFISMDVANQMISSYLYSINSAQNDTDVRSFTINADSLRAYLKNPAVKNIKLVLAHTINYINAGYYGVNAGYQSGAMTVVVAAYDAEGNYQYYNNGDGVNYVLDHAAPCPYSCPPGSAGNNLLQ